MQLHRKFYVYVHRRATNGSIFYVGKGTRNRLTSTASRSPKWHKIANECGFVAEKISNQMPNQCALSYEKAMMSAIGFDRICNVVMGGSYGMSGRKFDREVVDKRSKKCMKPVINSDGVIFQSLKDAAAHMRKIGFSNATEAHISSCCKGNRHVAFGFSWSFDTSKTPKLIDASSKVNEARKRCVIASNGMEFASITDAADWVRTSLKVKCGTSDISRCCNGKRKNCAGLEWKYYDV